MSLSPERPTHYSAAVFRRLDHEWSALCRRHRRQRVALDDWAAREPALAGVVRLDEVVPPPGVDRTARFDALRRLTRSGDALAARALLQLLVPGLARLAARLATRGGPAPDEVVGVAWTHIARLQRGTLTWRTPTSLLRSVRRELIAHQVAQRAAGPRPGRLWREWAGSGASAECEALAEPSARATLDAAVAAGLLSATAADLVWLCAVRDCGVAEAAAALGLPLSTAYRLRDRAHVRLRQALVAAS